MALIEHRNNGHHRWWELGVCHSGYFQSVWTELSTDYPVHQVLVEILLIIKEPKITSSSGCLNLFNKHFSHITVLLEPVIYEIPSAHHIELVHNVLVHHMSDRELSNLELFGDDPPQIACWVQNWWCSKRIGQTLDHHYNIWSLTMFLPLSHEWPLSDRGIQVVLDLKHQGLAEF